MNYSYPQSNSAISENEERLLINTKITSDSFFLSSFQNQNYSSLSKHFPNFYWKNVCYSILTRNTDTNQYVRKKILVKNYGIARRNQIMAIMGPSGSGKSTLLDILCDRLRPPKDAYLEKSVKMGSNNFGKKYFGTLASYVMQEDLLFETLTPRECLQFVANLKLTSPANERKSKVEGLISEMGLQECADNRIGDVIKKGISGGERKRTCIALELINDPYILFMDEPTSGLDSFTALKIMKILTNIKNEGRIIIMSIHQPSSDIMNLIDNLLLIVKGKEIYQGPYYDSIDFFKYNNFEIPLFSNPADYFMNFMHRKEPPTIVQLQRHKDIRGKYLEIIQSQIIKQIEEEENSKIEKIIYISKKTRNYNEIKLLTQRAALNFFRNRKLSLARFYQIIFVGFLACIVFYDIEGYGKSTSEVMTERDGIIFFVSFNQLFLSMQNVIVTFPIERSVFVREKDEKLYGTFNYLIAKSLVELPYQLLMPFLFACGIYFIINLRHGAGYFFVFCICLILMICSFVGNSYGLFLSSINKDEKVVIQFLPLTIIPFAIFCGYMLNIKNITIYLRWFCYLSPIRYSLELIMRNQYEDNPQIPEDDNPVDIFNYNLGFFNCLIIFIAMGFFYRFLTYLFLKYKS